MAGALLLCVVAPLGKDLPEPGPGLRVVVGLASQLVALSLCVRAMSGRPAGGSGAAVDLGSRAAQRPGGGMV
jgi:hypothetical protein